MRLSVLYELKWFEAVATVLQHLNLLQYGRGLPMLFHIYHVPTTELRQETGPETETETEIATEKPKKYLSIVGVPSSMNTKSVR